MQFKVLFNVLFLNYKFISWPISDNKVNNPLKEHFFTLNLLIRSDLTPKMVDFEVISPHFDTKMSDLGTKMTDFHKNDQYKTKFFFLIK